MCVLFTSWLFFPAGSPFTDARTAFRVAKEQAAATHRQRACGGTPPSWDGWVHEPYFLNIRHNMKLYQFHNVKPFICNWLKSSSKELKISFLVHAKSHQMRFWRVFLFIKSIVATSVIRLPDISHQNQCTVINHSLLIICLKEIIVYDFTTV